MTSAALRQPLAGLPFLYTRLLRGLTGYSRRLSAEIEAGAALARRMAGAARAPVFVDCGFNEGLVLDGFRRALPDFAVVGYEIQPVLHARARRARPELDLRHAAVSDAEGEATLFLPGGYRWNYNGGASTLPQAGRAAGVTVRAADFAADLAALRARHDFVAVKMDVEGAEYRVLRRVLAAETRLIDLLFIEFHPELAAPGEDEALRAALDAKGVRWVEWL